MAAINMIGKSTSEVQPIAKDETRAEEKASANGTIRQDVLDEFECTRNFVRTGDLPGFTWLQARRTVGKMRDADRVYPWWGSQQGYN